jgi:peptidylprolyl isomerase
MLRRIVMAVAGAALLAGTASAWAGPADDPANWRKVDAENLLQLTVNGSEILVELRPDVAPRHITQIKKITREKAYDGIPFHRVIDQFMVQGGDTELGKPPKRYPLMRAEFTWKRDPAKQPVQWVGTTADGEKLGYLDGFLVQGQPDEVAMISSPPEAQTWMLHCPGVASMARTSAPNSANAQFFLMRQARVGESGLDEKYTAWGWAVQGLPVIRAVKAGPEDANGVLPIGTADVLTKAVIVADLPAKQQPVVYVRRTDGPEFAATLAGISVADPAAACALPPVDVIVERPSP